MHCSCYLTTDHLSDASTLPLIEYLSSKQLRAITDHRTDSCPWTKAAASLWTSACQSSCRVWTTAWCLWFSNCFSCPPVVYSILLNMPPDRIRLSTRLIWLGPHGVTHLKVIGTRPTDWQKTKINHQNQIKSIAFSLHFVLYILKIVVFRVNLKNIIVTHCCWNYMCTWKKSWILPLILYSGIFNCIVYQIYITYIYNYNDMIIIVKWFLNCEMPMSFI